MSKLKSFMIPAMAVVLAASALPASASAQSHRGHPAPMAAVHTFEVRKDSLERRIDRAVASRRLDFREGRDLKRELTSISRMQRDMMRGGLDRRERIELDRRYDRLEGRIDREIRQERRDDRRGRR